MISAVNPPGRGTRRLALWKPLFGLAGLSLIWALEALVPDLIPEIKPSGAESLAEHSLSFGLVAVLAALNALLEGSGWPRGRMTLVFAGIGCGLFVLPGLLVRGASNDTSAYERTLLFSLVPVFALVLESHIGTGSDAPLRGGLMAALACAAGVWLVFPVNLPSTISAGIALGIVLVAALLIAMMSCLAQKLLSAGEDDRKLGPFKSGSAGAAVMAGGAALGFLLAQAINEGWRGFVDSALPRFHWDTHASAMHAWTMLAWATIDATGWWLLLWLLPLLRPSRAATRYVFAPVLTVVLGVLLLRVAGQSAILQGRTVVGVLIMSAGAVYLVIAPEISQNDEDGRGLGLG